MNVGRGRAVAYGLVVVVGFAAVDAAIGESVRISGSFALGAIVAGVLGGFGAALPTSAVALVLSLISGTWNDDFGSSGYFARLFVCFAGTLLALGAGRLHDRAGSQTAEFLRILSGRVAFALDDAGLSEELSSVEQQLQAILENLGEAVTVQDRSGRLVFANRAAAELLGADSVDQLVSMLPGELMERFSSVHADGRPIAEDDLPGRALLAGRDAKPLLVRSRDRRTGEESWRMTKSTAVRGPDGEVLLAVNIIEDVTDTKRAEFTQRLLSDASGLLASSLDYTQTLPRVAELAVPSFADWCAISVAVGDTLELVADAHGELAVSELADQVFRSGSPLLVEPEDEAISSALIVPMATPERVVGVLSLAATASRRRFGENDVELALELGRRAAAALENARLYNELGEIATTLQRSLLPPAMPDVPGWRAHALYMPAGEGIEVGGDFYDVFPTAAGWMAVIGDVVGRGPAAASLTAMARYTLRTAGSLVGTPTMGLARLNDNLRDRGDMALCTAAVLLLRETGDASLALAGHPQPLLVRAGEACPVGRIGPLLGAFEHAHWLPASIAIESGDVIILYTDGVLDARGADERFGEQRLVDALHGASGARDAVERIQQAMIDFAGGEQDDDTAVLTLEKL